MTTRLDAIGPVLDAVAARGDTVLVEPDGFPLLEAVGIGCPIHATVVSSDEARQLDLQRYPGARVVVKIASSRVLHRSDVGGVAVVEKRPEMVAGTIARMEQALPREGRLGFTVSAFVPHDAALGSELLLGLRHTDDFGPVVTVGAGGIYTEFLARHFAPGNDVAILPVEGMTRDAVERRLRALPVVQLLAGGLRRQAAQLDLSHLVEAVDAFMTLGRAFVPERLLECEVNPLVVTPDGLVALDVLARLGRPSADVWPARPLHKLRNLLQPRSAAIVGVSESMNPGHVILCNLLREGFSPNDIVVVKPGAERIEGCRCVPDIASIPGTVDLLVLAIAAAQVPAAIGAAIEHRKAESLIVIPGGLEEKAGGRDLLVSMYEALKASRASAWRGPVVNGGNCLGVRSLPGRYDTMFIPAYKLPVRPTTVSPVALVTQSGAFAIAKAAKFAQLNPKYVITVGNQMDLTVGDYLDYLADDDTIRLFGVYVEGFRPLDGKRLLAAAQRIVASGRHVVLYRAGRTQAGAAASASHTASIAGDYAVTRELASEAGVVVAETLDDFEDLVSLFAALGDRPPKGRRLGAVSNAGFECVAMADSLGRLELAAWSDATRRALGDALRAARIDSLVDVHNPLDITPMADDATYETIVRAVLDDDGIDVGLVGCVPLTPALSTLAPGAGHREDLSRDSAYAARLGRVAADVGKPWVAVVDGGPLYEPLVARLVAAGIPTFRTADRALRMLNVWVDAGLKLGPQG